LYNYGKIIRIPTTAESINSSAFMDFGGETVKHIYLPGKTPETHPGLAESAPWGATAAEIHWNEEAPNDY
jgi:hypothetical protein